MLVENTEARITHLDGETSLKPGINFVDDAVFEKFASTKFGAAHIEAGHIRVVEGSEMPAPVEGALLPAGEVPPHPATSALAAYSEKEAVKHVKATYDRGLLELWAGVETRKPVIEAIEKQFDKLKPVQPEE